jgi:hypothetical protein
LHSGQQVFCELVQHGGISSIGTPSGGIGSPSTNPNFLAPPSPHTATSSTASSAASSPAGMPTRSLTNGHHATSISNDDSDDITSEVKTHQPIRGNVSPSPATLTISTSDGSSPGVSPQPPPGAAAAAYAQQLAQAAAMSPMALHNATNPHLAAAMAAAYYPTTAAAASMYPSAAISATMMAAMAGGGIGPNGEEISAASAASAAYLADAISDNPSLILLVSIFDPRVAITTEFIYYVRHL